VQVDNYREMGDAVDLAREVGANSVHFGRITNWGTFDTEHFRHKAVFLPSHPEHEQFVAAINDTRLRDPIALLGDLADFVVMPAKA